MRSPSKETSNHGRSNRARGPRAFARRHGLISFYALAYGLSWLAWLPYVLSQYGLGILHISYPQLLGPEELVGQLGGVLAGAYLGPLGAAFIVTALTGEGRACAAGGGGFSGGVSASGGTCSP